jgi:hypothetical protein
MTTAFKVFIPVPPKDRPAAISVRSRFKKKQGPAASNKEINLKPFARSGSSPPLSAPGGDSSMLCLSHVVVTSGALTAARLPNHPYHAVYQIQKGRMLLIC